MKPFSMPHPRERLAHRWFRSIPLAFIIYACGGSPAPEYPAEPGATSQPPATTQPGFAPPPSQAPAPGAPGVSEAVPASEAEAPAAAPQDLLEDEAAPAGDEPANLSEALAALERAKAELEGALSAPKAAGAASELSRKARAANCGRACQALDSLERAAQAICNLTAPNDDRCRSALETLRRNQGRTAACGC